MSAWLLGAVGGAYIWVAVGYFAQGRVGMGLAFAAYAAANVGFILDLR